MSSLSLCHGVRCVVQASVSFEDVLLGIGEHIGHENIALASRTNKAVVIFLKDVQLANRLVESGIWVSGIYVPVIPLLFHNKGDDIQCSTIYS